MNAEVDLGPLIKDRVTMTLHVKGVYRAELRIRAASLLVRLAAWVGGMKFREAIEVDERE